MQKYIKKADILVKALPYIQSFKDEVIVIKYGGAAFLNEEVRSLLLQDIVFLSTVGIKPVLVHGGGPLISQEIRNQGQQPKFIDGVRITGKKDMKIVSKVLGDLNKSLVSQIEGFNGKAHSFTGDKNLLHTEPLSDELGYVGKITKIKVSLLKDLLDKGCIPVISPIGKGKGKDLYNVNADSVSSEVAVALDAKKLVLLTHVEGIMRDIEDKTTLISSLYTDEVQQLIDSGIIKEGMIPKVNAGCFVISKGVSKAHIINGNLPHALLLEIFTDEGVGTQILDKGK